MTLPLPIETWLLFIALWFGLAAFPGPNAAFAMSVGSRRGDRAALAAAAGFAVGVAVYVVLIGLGLIAFLAASAELFEILRWLGVAYLAYLAWQSWHAPTDPAQPPRIEKREAWGIAVKASMITLTNPKSALSYVLAYPAFMTADSSTHEGLEQLFLIGTTSVVISFLIYATYGLTAGRLGRLIKNRRQALLRNRVFALLFAGAGIALATAGRR